MSERRPRRKKEPTGTLPATPSTPPPDFRADGFTPNERPPWQRPGLIIPIAVIVLIVCIAAALLFAFNRTQQAQQPDDNETVSRASAAPVPSGTPINDIGSGGALNGGWYQLYFTAPKYPDNPANHKGGIDEKLVALIDTAKTSVDIADYDFDLANVADAMVRAKGRGATVRMVTDTDTLSNTKDAAIVAAFGKLQKASIPIVDDKRSPIMHNKFTVVDKIWVSTGSWNYTDGDTYRLNNNMIVINSPELAANYSTEFAKMFEKRQFGPTKDKAIPNSVVTVNGTRIENCFASEGKCASQIVSTIKGSKQSIRFMAFSFTSDPIEAAMAERSKAGVTVSGVFETTGSQTAFSAYGKLKKEGLPVYTDGNPWVMHHKVIIIDDRIVIFGSFNFSDNADTQNDENLLIVDNPEIARAFKAEFDRVLALAQNPPTKK
jgi:phosphatidylserine/phosphatidylglycerophosphate/cardiolipin synthase-like enzyme